MINVSSSEKFWFVLFLFFLLFPYDVRPNDVNFLSFINAEKLKANFQVLQHVSDFPPNRVRVSSLPALARKWTNYLIKRINGSTKMKTGNFEWIKIFPRSFIPTLTAFVFVFEHREMKNSYRQIENWDALTFACRSYKFCRIWFWKIKALT